MATPTAPRDEHLDVVLPELMADLRKRQAQLLDTLQQHMSVSDGRMAEQRHFLDADVDTAFPLPGVAHPKTTALRPMEAAS